jgi:hypothetical protein
MAGAFVGGRVGETAGDPAADTERPGGIGAGCSAITGMAHTLMHQMIATHKDIFLPCQRCCTHLPPIIPLRFLASPLRHVASHGDEMRCIPPYNERVPSLLRDLGRNLVGWGFYPVVENPASAAHWSANDRDDAGDCGFLSRAVGVPIARLRRQHGRNSGLSIG